MPYDNKYNRAIAQKGGELNQTHINYENAINDNVQPNDPVTSQVESMTLKHPDIVGGNGYAAATLGDMGFEPTMGAEGSAKPKKPRKKKGEGIAGAGGICAGLAAAGMAAAGVASARADGRWGHRRGAAHAAGPRQIARTTSNCCEIYRRRLY